MMTATKTPPQPTASETPPWVDDPEPPFDLVPSIVDAEGPLIGESSDVLSRGPQGLAGSIPVPSAITVQPRQHLVVGVGALAALSPTEFEHNIAQLVEGQRRVQVLTDKLLIQGQDYGRVPGIPKPFLQKPGAEKLGNFYGLAVRFEAERIIGDGEKSPQLAYHVKSYAHLGSFDGPVVAQGYGEASVWEERYRYRNEEPTCPECGRVGLIKRKSPPSLAGKWNCPAWGGKGGCNRVFEPNDERIKSGGKVENSDPWSLANTLVKMAEKRAHVDVILRATGTSGFFSQDEDSPSVQAQASAEGPGEPVVENVTETIEVARGGRTAQANETQIARLIALSRERDLGPDKVAAAITRITGTEVPELTGNRREKGVQLLEVVKQLSADELGAVLNLLDTGELPLEVPEQETATALAGDLTDHAAH